MLHDGKDVSDPYYQSPIAMRSLGELKSSSLLHQLLSEPMKLNSLDNESLHLFVRSFYRRVADMEEFCNTFPPLFEAYMTTTPAPAPPPISPSPSTVAISSPAIATVDDYTEKINNESEAIVHMYHMVIAMDGVYEYLLQRHEDLRTDMRKWLLHKLSSSMMQLSISTAAVTAISTATARTDDLRAVVYCLQREKLIYGAEVLDITQTYIQAALNQKVLHVDGSAPVMSSLRFFNSNEDHEGHRGQVSIEARLTEPLKSDATIPSNTTTATTATTSTTATSSKLNPPKYDFRSMAQFMHNAVSTCRVCLHHILPTLPVEIDLMAILQLYLVKYIHMHVSSVFMKHKQSLKAVELFEICTFYDRLRVLSADVCRNTTVNLMTNVLDLQKELYAQSCRSISADMTSEMMTIAAATTEDYQIDGSLNEVAMHHLHLQSFIYLFSHSFSHLLMHLFIYYSFIRSLPPPLM